AYAGMLRAQNELGIPIDRLGMVFNMNPAPAQDVFRVPNPGDAGQLSDLSAFIKGYFTLTGLNAFNFGQHKYAVLTNNMPAWMIDGKDDDMVFFYKKQQDITWVTGHVAFMVDDTYVVD